MKMNIWKYSEIDSKKNELEGKKVVLVGGCFDLLHYGHFTFLQQAKKQGEVLVVALEPDEFIQKKKNRKPIHSQQQRAEILASLQMVDYIVLLPLLKSDQEYADLVTKINPAIIAVTEGDPNISHKQKHSKKVNAQVVVVSSLVPEFSTTQIMNYENIFSN